MTRGNGINGKHDGWKFTVLNIVRVGTILDRISWVGIIRVRIARAVIILRGDFPGRNCQVEIIRVAIFRLEVFLVPFRFRL